MLQVLLIISIKYSITGTDTENTALIGSILCLLPIFWLYEGYSFFKHEFGQLVDSCQISPTPSRLTEAAEVPTQILLQNQRKRDMGGKVLQFLLFSAITI